jgi:hypothetical protein
LDTPSTAVPAASNFFLSALKAMASVVQPGVSSFG